MTLAQALREAAALFARHGIEDPRLVSELLLRHALSIGRVRLYQELKRKLTLREEAGFGRLIERCLNGEPVAYITGHREFYGLDFYVDRSVLVPRPETELLVERAIALVRERNMAVIADIGTGSGAVAVSLALNLPQARIYATDVSAPALKVARFNCRKHGVGDRVYLLKGNLLSPLPQPVSLIVANLPYVGEEEVSLRGLAGFEPALALSGGGDGLEKIRALCRGLGRGLRPGGGLLLEVGMGQSRAVASLLLSLFPGADIEITRDLAGIERVVGLMPLSAGAPCLAGLSS
jgi:release factor glutamine methyltransferase